MERLKKHETDRARIIGTVDNLDEAYARCDCVVSPIFCGSGMKVKIADAFRHGKTVVGTPESFTGYHITDGKEGYVCETDREFIQAFREIANNQRKKINRASVSYFYRYLSKTCALNNYINIFQDIYQDALVS
jgi:glycosyltransferase involved in cell wall biosynthesis